MNVIYENSNPDKVYRHSAGPVELYRTGSNLVVLRFKRDRATQVEQVWERLAVCDNGKTLRAPTSVINTLKSVWGEAVADLVVAENQSSRGGAYGDR